MTTTTLLSSVLLLALDPAVDQLADRPYGATMGDGLRFSREPGPVGGGICADGDTVFGIDVSYYQGDIDWNAVAADGVEYAIVRVSHSTQFFDPEFDTNLAGSRAAGLHTGVYQYFEPDEDPIAQADLLLEALGPLQPGDLPPVIDVESTAGLPPAQVAAAVREWVDHVEAALGVPPIIYTGYYFWNDSVASADFGSYPLWIAWYNECPGHVPTGWSEWAFHQYCDCGTVAGISGQVDVNRFNGSLADLAALGAMPVCGDGTCGGGEDPVSCPEDCEPCGMVSPAGGTIDNGDACYGLHGNPDYWREEAEGEGGSLVWTNATDNPEPSNYAQWELYFEESGLYDVQVHIVQPFGESTQAGYRIAHAGGEEVVTLDQSANDGWVSLGAFEFEAAMAHAITLGDNTGEPNDGEVSIVFDAVQLTRLDMPEGTSGGLGESSGGDAESSGGEPPGGTSGDPSEGSSGGMDSGPALPPEDGDAGGCGCRSDGSSGTPWLLLGLLGLLRRRRY
jgi:MYXO-CTERM domain-containing protein